MEIFIQVFGLMRLLIKPVIFGNVLLFFGLKPNRRLYHPLGLMQFVPYGVIADIMIVVYILKHFF